jgi:hypothetical protein
MKSVGELSFNHLIPLELFHEIQLFCDDRDYYKLITSMKFFSEVKFRTRKIHLTEVEATEFLENPEYHQLILSKIANPVIQLCIKLTGFPEEASSCDVLSSTPMQRLEILLERPNQIYMMKVQPEFADTAVWECFLKDKRDISISNAIFATSFPHLLNTQSLNIHRNHRLADVGSLSHMKKVFLCNCGILSNVSCLKSVEHLQINACQSIVDVSALGNVHRLELIACSRITDVSALINSSYLILSGCAGLRKFPTHFNGFKFFLDDPTIVLKNMICPNLKYYEALAVSAMQEQALRGLNLQFPALFYIKIESCHGIQSLGQGLNKIGCYHSILCSTRGYFWVRRE